MRTVKGIYDIEKRKELLEYFIQCYKETKPLEYSVKNLIEEGQR